jgi:uridine kinase
MPYSVAIIITGVFRSFNEKLWPFLNKLPDNFHFYLNIPNNSIDDSYYNKKMSINNIIDDKRIKIITIDNSELNIPEITQREKNLILQWYRINKIYEQIPNTYDLYVRCRPDIQIMNTIDDFLSIFENILSKNIKNNILYIPYGFDQTNVHLLSKESSNTHCINDQFAIGTYTIMKHYANLYSESQFVSPIISENILYNHLQKHNIEIQRFKLSYKLVLSECFVISICGDSASGKSTLSKLIQETLPFDKTVLLETDRYHKWERGNPNYQTYTHLHPEANNLEKLSEDAFKLKLGEDVFTVDYDHSTGRFTEPEHIQSAPYTIFCGLHTLYKESLRDICDLKIFIETEEELKKKWKLERDAVERGASFEKIVETIEKRRPDFKKYIEPQKENADIILKYYQDNDQYKSIRLNLQLRKIYDMYVNKQLTPYSEKIIENDEWIIYEFKKNICENTLKDEIKKMKYNIQYLKDGYHGIIQYIILLLIWKH